MNSETTDYIILSVQNPAFNENIELMINTILEAGGTSPTEIIKYKDGKAIPGTDPIEYEQIPYSTMNPMVGTGGQNGRIMFHFRLPDFYNAADLITFLQQGMANPKPPVSVESIRSAYKILEVGEEMEYEITVQAMKAKFGPYMAEDELGEFNMFLSGYFGSDPVELA